MSTATALTVTEACARIPDGDIENAAQQLIDVLGEHDIHVPSEDREAVVKLIKAHLLWTVNRALWALEPVTIVADPEDD